MDKVTKDLLIVVLIIIGFLWFNFYQNSSLKEEAKKEVVEKIHLDKLNEAKDKIENKFNELGLKNFNKNDLGLKDGLEEESNNFFDKLKYKFNKIINWNMSDNDSEKYIKTDSGLEYRIIKKGDGVSRPTLDDTVVVNYEGRFEDGRVFESTYKMHPVSFRLDSVIKGWQEGLQLMSPGDIFEFRIPPELGYGEFDYYEIPGGSTLIFKVELLGIE